MKGFTHIDKVVVSMTHLGNAFDYLYYAGKKRAEAVSLFAGYSEDNSFYIEELIIPKQKCFKGKHGLMYTVDGEELHRINTWLFENKMSLIAQIHSHPEEAYHSPIDDRYPIVDTFGGFSLVVPYYATGILSMKDWACYRLSEKNKWNELSESQINTLFQIT
ncbi:MAG: Mov34/MPN/PAD-1 family protein [Bacteroidales bacterium]|nr:Mov34/MPN/PAD-1 family protein [Bacteroidales bacterium]MCF8390340.1 Mov34/MPN/PAD-1 family protein [Bacteroidales bacterium]